MTSVAVVETSHLRDAAQPGIDAIKRFWKPFVLIQLCGLAFVILYYMLPSLARALEGVASLKAQYGYGFSFVAGVIGGAIVPEIFKVLSMREEKITRHRLRELFFALFYFGFMSALCDGLYRLLDLIIGTEASVTNAALKTLADQGLFTPTFGCCIAAIYFPLFRSNWDFQKVLGGFGGEWYLKNVLPILLPAWCYWIPMCVLMYSMPSLLQVPFCVTATAAWGLMVTAVTAHRHHRQA